MHRLRIKSASSPRGICADSYQFRSDRHAGLLASLDVVALNPAFDVHNRTAELAVGVIESLFGKSTLMRKN